MGLLCHCNLHPSMKRSFLPRARYGRLVALTMSYSCISYHKPLLRLTLPPAARLRAMRYPFSGPEGIAPSAPVSHACPLLVRALTMAPC